MATPITLVDSPKTAPPLGTVLKKATTPREGGGGGKKDGKKRARVPTTKGAALVKHKALEGVTFPAAEDYHNWHCTVCRKGGQLLCCQTCPKAWHLECLDLAVEDLPQDGMWLCKQCSETVAKRVQRELERQTRMQSKAQDKAAKAVKTEVARVAREAKRLEKSVRDAERQLEALNVKSALKKPHKKQFPVDDDDLGAFPPPAEPLPSRPEPSRELGIPGPVASDVLMVWDFLRAFGVQAIVDLNRVNCGERVLALHPRLAGATDDDAPAPALPAEVLGSTPADIVSALSDTSFRSQRFLALIHIALLKVVAASGHTFGDADSDDDDDAPDGQEAALDHLDPVTWPEVLRLQLSVLDSSTSYVLSPEAQHAVAALESTDYVDLTVADKLALLRALMDAVSGSKYMMKAVMKISKRRLGLLKERSALEARQAADARKDRAEEAARRKELKEEAEKRKAATAETATQKAKDKWKGWAKGGDKDDGDDSDPTARLERRRAEIVEELEAAVESRDIGVLREVIGKARENGFETGRGSRKRRDPELQAAVDTMNAVEAEERRAATAVKRQAQAAKELLDIDKKLIDAALSALLVGTDAARRRYWVFGQDFTRLFVETLTLDPSQTVDKAAADRIGRAAVEARRDYFATKKCDFIPDIKAEPTAPRAGAVAGAGQAPSPPPKPKNEKKRKRGGGGGDGDGAGAGDEGDDKPGGEGEPKKKSRSRKTRTLTPEMQAKAEAAAEGNVFKAPGIVAASHPRRFTSVWSVYRTMGDLEALLESCDVRGVREKALAEQLTVLLPLFDKAMQAVASDDSDEGGEEGAPRPASAYGAVAPVAIRQVEPKPAAAMSRLRAEEWAEQDAILASMLEEVAPVRHPLDGAPAAVGSLAAAQSALLSFEENCKAGLGTRGLSWYTVSMEGERDAWIKAVVDAQSASVVAKQLLAFERLVYEPQRRDRLDAEAKAAEEAAKEAAKAAAKLAEKDGGDAGDGEGAQAGAGPDGEGAQAGAGPNGDGDLPLDGDGGGGPGGAPWSDGDSDAMAEDEEEEDDEQGHNVVWRTRGLRRRFRRRLRGVTTVGALGLAVRQLRTAAAGASICMPCPGFVPDDVLAQKAQIEADRAAPAPKGRRGRGDRSSPPLPPPTRSSRRATRSTQPKYQETSSDDDSDDNSDDEEAEFEIGDEEEVDDEEEEEEEGLGASRGGDMWSDTCFVCGERGELMCCDGCTNAVHAACVGLADVPEEFFCENCEKERCGKCGKGRIFLHSNVMCGSSSGDKRGCDRVFHLECTGLDEVPDADWFCPDCA